jgi:hypothetical protein
MGFAAVGEAWAGRQRRTHATILIPGAPRVAPPQVLKKPEATALLEAFNKRAGRAGSAIASLPRTSSATAAAAGRTLNPGAGAAGTHGAQSVSANLSRVRENALQAVQAAATAARSGASSASTQVTLLEPMGRTLSYLACRIGRLVLVWQRAAAPPRRPLLKSNLSGTAGPVWHAEQGVRSLFGSASQFLALLGQAGTLNAAASRLHPIP